MPDQDGKLTADEQQKIVQHLNDKGKNHVCPICGKNNWAIGDRLLNGLPHTQGAFVIGGPTYPMAFTVCNNCAYVRHFMAIPLGLLEGAEKSKSGEPSDG